MNSNVIKSIILFLLSVIISLFSIFFIVSQAHGAELLTAHQLVDLPDIEDPSETGKMIADYSPLPKTDVILLQNKLNFKTNAILLSNTAKYVGSSGICSFTLDENGLGLKVNRFGQIPTGDNWTTLDGEVQILFQNVGFDSLQNAIDLKIKLYDISFKRFAGSGSFIVFGKNTDATINAPYLFISEPGSTLANASNPDTKGAVDVKMHVEVVKHTELSNIINAEPVLGTMLLGFDRIDSVSEDSSIAERVKLIGGFDNIYMRQERNDNLTISSGNDVFTATENLDNATKFTSGFTSGFLTNVVASSFKSQIRTSDGFVYVLRTKKGGTLTTSATSGGTIFPSASNGLGGTYEYPYNATAIVAITPKMGNTIKTITVDGIQIDVDNPLYREIAFQNITDNHSVQVEFSQTSGEISITTTTPNELLRQQLGYNFEGVSYVAFADRECIQHVYSSSGMDLSVEPQRSGPDGVCSYLALKFTGDSDYHRTYSIPQFDEHGNPIMETDDEGNQYQKTEVVNEIINGGITPTYFIKQSSSSNGMEVDSNVYELNLSRGVDSSLVFTNYIKTSKLRLHIESKQKNITDTYPQLFSNENAVFSVINSAGDIADTITTDENGNAESKFLPKGTYTIVQNTAGKGYTINTDNIAFEVTDSDLYKSDVDYSTKNITIKNEPGLGSFGINVLSTVEWTDNNAMYDFSSLKFRIIGPQEAEVPTKPVNVEYSYADVEAGRTLILPLGTYKIEEIALSSSFVRTTELEDISIPMNGVNISKTIEYRPLLNTDTMTVSKYDIEGWNDNPTFRNPLPIGGINLYGANYRISYYDALYSTETEIPENVSPKWITYSQTIEKEDGTAKFTFPDADKSDDGYVVEEDGAMTYGYPLGTYVIQEEAAPEGYALSTDISIIQVIRGIDNLLHGYVVKGLVSGNASSPVNEINNMVVIDEPEKSDIVIYKTGSTFITNDTLPEDTIPLSGVEFQIINNSFKPIRSIQTGEFVEHGQVIYTITTNAEGIASTQTIASAAGANFALALGNYIIHESKPAPGYAPAEDTQVSITTAGKSYRFDIDNRSGTAIEIVKKTNVPNKNGVKLPIASSAKFSIVKEDGSLWTTTGGINEFTSSADGKLFIGEKLVAGNYKLREIQAPKGFECAQNDVPFVIDGSTVNSFRNPKQIEIFDDPIKSEAVIYVIDGENRSRIFGRTVLNIKTKDAIRDSSGTIFYPANHDLGDFTTETGEIQLADLHPGTYIVSQKVAADGYQLNTRTYELVIPQNKTDNAIVLEFPNYQRKGGIKVSIYTKDPGWHDWNENDKWTINAAATFEVCAADNIYDNNGSLIYAKNELVQSMTTNQNGFVMTDDYFVQGSYIVSETIAPNGYMLSETPSQTVVISDENINASESLSLSFYHRLQKGSIKIAKTDKETGYLITASPAIFEIYAGEIIKPLDGHVRYNTGDLIETVTTDATGYAMSSKLYTGAYYIRERISPVGYMKSNDVINARVVYTGQNNESAAGDVTLVGVPGEKIQGTLRFSATNAETNASISPSGMTLVIKAAQEYKDSFGRTIYNIGDEVETVVVSSNDDTFSKNLPIGRYTVEEIVAPQGYRIHEGSIPVEIVSTGLEQEPVIVDVVVSHTGQKGTITIENRHADTGFMVATSGGIYIVSSVNDIYAEDGTRIVRAGEEVDRVVIGVNGQGLSRELWFGQYLVSQESVPNGYINNHDSTEVFIGNGDQSIPVINKTIDFRLLQPKASIQVALQDMDTNSNIKLSNVGVKVFAKSDIMTPEGRLLYKADDTVCISTTNDNGLIEFNGLHSGAYYIKVVETPNGYNSNYSQYDINVIATVNNSPISNLIIPFKEQMGVISVKVVDENNANIANSNSKFSVIAVDNIIGKDGIKRYSRGDSVAELIANDGTASTTPLSIGRYKIVQKSVASGYVIAQDEVLTSVVYAGDNKEEASAETIVFVNPKQQSIPDEPSKPKPVQLIANGNYVVATNASNTNSKVIDIACGSTQHKANAWIYSRNNTDAQVFTFAYDNATDTYKISNYNSGKYLTAANGARNGSNLQQENAADILAQKWKISRNSNGSYTIKSAINENFVIDLNACNTANGTNIHIWESNKSVAQQWNIIKTTPIAIAGKTVEDGTYTLVSGVSSSMALDINAASKANGANAQIWTSNGTGAQKFVFTYDGRGFYTIKCVGTGKYLDAAGAGTWNGTNVHQWEGNGTDAQKWFISKTANGYTIANKISGKMLDVNAGLAINGINVHIWTPNGTAAQRWILKK